MEERKAQAIKINFNSGSTYSYNIYDDIQDKEKFRNILTQASDWIIIGEHLINKNNINFIEYVEKNEES